MKIDCHVHSYPLFMPGGSTRFSLAPVCSGITLEGLKRHLQKRESNDSDIYGVFYGGNTPMTLPKKPNEEYMLKRVLPMNENHLIQIIGVTSWENTKPLELLSSCKTQIEGIEAITQNGGIAIIDQPRIIYKRPSIETNRVNISHRGEATIEELYSLSEKSKKRTFLDYSSMGLPFDRERAEKLSQITNLRLIGGSDTIIRESSLFSAYSLADTKDIREVLENPFLINSLIKGALPWHNVERLQRASSVIAEEVMGVDRRERIHARLVDDYLINKD